MVNLQAASIDAHLACMPLPQGAHKHYQSSSHDSQSLSRTSFKSEDPLVITVMLQPELSFRLQQLMQSMDARLQIACRQ